MTHFTYLWFDKARRMFYIGVHSGKVTDTYCSSQRWLSGEIAYRPADFSRRVLKHFDTRAEAIQEESRLLKMIKPEEFLVRYYNRKTGVPKGTKPWNTGKIGVFSEEVKKQISDAKKGKPSWNKGLPNPTAAENGKKSAAKVAAKARGRKRSYREDGSWFWIYPENSGS